VPDDTATELDFTGPADPRCLDHIHELLARLWEKAPDVTGRDRALFATAVGEVAANIIKHGHGAGRTNLSVILRVDGTRIEAVFSDDGVPVDLDPAGPSLPGDLAESGRGLALVRAAVDLVTYERAGTLNRWHLVRRRNSPPG
jgi:serine/threonine-protein kinase RsbW